MLKKRLIALAAALMVGSAVSLPVSAASITINGAIEGQTYNAYKIFDVTRSASDSYAYTIDGESAWYNVVQRYASAEDDEDGLTLTPAGDVYNVSVTDSFSAADFAAYLAENIGTIQADGTVDGGAVGTTTTIGDLEPG